MSPPFLGAAEKREYAENGYRRLGPVLADAGLAEMRDQCMAAWRAEKGEFDRVKTWLQNALMNDIHHRSPIVRDYDFRGPLVEVAQ